MDNVIALPMPHEMAEYAQTEAQWRRDPSLAIVIKRHARRDGDDIYAR